MHFFLSKPLNVAGVSKIYMRESQKMRLDIKLHTKIIDSIIMIQRWFRSILQRRKYLNMRSAAVTIQSFWRMGSAQKQVVDLKSQVHSVVLIQATWRMFITRKWYQKLRNGTVLIQSHIRGLQARNKYKGMVRQKLLKERSKLRPTQSLPVHERSIDLCPDSDLIKRSFNKPHSVDTDYDSVMKNRNLYSTFYTNPANYSDENLVEYSEDMLSKAENQFRSLMISSGNNNKNLVQEEVDRPGSNRTYDLERATKSYEDDSEMLKRFDVTKTPVRRVDSGPAPIRRDARYTITGAPTVYQPETNMEIIFVNSPQQQLQQQLQQPQPQPNKLQRRELHCRSTGDEINSNFSNYQNVSYSSSGSPINPANSPYFQQQQQQQSLPPPILNLKDKAAVILGTINEDKKSTRNPEIGYAIRARRTVKTNLSDEFAGAVPVTSRRGLPSTDSLRRRNSDPTNKIPLLEVNRGNDMYQSSTHINIAGHKFRKATRIGKAEKCASCQESDAFVNEGYRCLDCKVLVHTKCIQNGGVKSLHCGDNKRAKALRKNTEKNSDKCTPNSKYAGSREYKDSTDKIICDAKELQLMQDFITQKICKMDNDCENPSEVDRVFKQALREFKDNLVAQYSVAHKQNSDALNIKYRDLISNFEQVMETCCGKKDDFPLTMGVNAFRGFMNEFMSSRETEKPKAKRKKEKRRKVEEHTSYLGE